MNKFDYVHNTLGYVFNTCGEHIHYIRYQHTPKSDILNACFTTSYLLTVSAHIEPRGSIFQNEFLGGVLLIFGIGGVVIKMGFY